MIFWALMHRKECKNDELEDVAEMRWEDGEETPHLSVCFYIVVCDRQFDMLPYANQKVCIRICQSFAGQENRSKS